MEGDDAVGLVARRMPGADEGEPQVRYLAEDVTANVITHEIAYEAVKAALLEASSDRASVFPVVIAHAADPSNAFSIKSASSDSLAGVKIGSYWPGNESLGLPAHGTMVLLLDPATGRVAAAVEASTVNAYRTAAADAVAADLLARTDARTLAIFGNGHQALYECRALARIRPIERVLVVARNPDRGQAFCVDLSQHGIDAEVADARDACEQADIVVTATPARAPLFDSMWIKPGTHLASMGSDAKGKQEMPPSLLLKSRLFCDLPAQSLVIGEFQHVADYVVEGRLPLTPIGAVLAGVAPGRLSDDDITVFDSSGIALQDLAVAEALLGLIPDDVVHTID